MSLFFMKRRAASGSFDPSSIAGLKLWLKADSLALSDGAAVSAWNDSSVNGNNASQATGNQQPIYKVNIINGKPVVRFDQILTQEDNLNVADFGLTQPATVFIVTKYNQAISGTGNDTLFDGSVNNSMRGLRSAANVVQEFAGGFGPSVTTTPESFHVYTFIFNGASSSLRVDGGTAGTGNPGTASPGGIRLNYSGGGSDPGGQDMAEFIVYNSSLSLANSQAVELYLKTKYATP